MVWPLLPSQQPVCPCLPTLFSFILWWTACSSLQVTNLFLLLFLLANFCWFFSLQLVYHLPFDIFSDTRLFWWFLVTYSSAFAILITPLHFFHSSLLYPVVSNLRSGTTVLPLRSSGPNTGDPWPWLDERMINSQRMLQSPLCVTAKRFYIIPLLFFIKDAFVSHQISFNHYRNRTNEHLLT